MNYHFAEIIYKLFLVQIHLYLSSSNICTAYPTFFDFYKFKYNLPIIIGLRTQNTTYFIESNNSNNKICRMLTLEIPSIKYRMILVII